MLKLGTKWNQVRRVEMMLTGEKLTILPWCWKMLPRHSIAVLKRQKRRQDVAHMSWPHTCRDPTRRDPTHVVIPHMLWCCDPTHSSVWHKNNVVGNVSRTFYSTNILGNDEHSSSVWKTPDGSALPENPVVHAYKHSRGILFINKTGKQQMGKNKHHQTHILYTSLSHSIQY